MHGDGGSDVTKQKYRFSKTLSGLGRIDIHRIHIMALAKYRAERKLTARRS
jgi:hypothetical protein